MFTDGSFRDSDACLSSIRSIEDKKKAMSASVCGNIIIARAIVKEVGHDAEVGFG